MYPEDVQFSSRQIRRLLLQYEVLRSASEIAAVRFEDSAGKNNNPGDNQAIICTVMDIDRALTALPRRQQAIVALFKAGLNSTEIAEQLHLSNATIKFHLKNAIMRIDTYLNH